MTGGSAHLTELFSNELFSKRSKPQKKQSEPT